MKSTDEIAAVVLAGGLATRMGGEKPLRVLRGRTLLEHALVTCAAVSSEVLVSSGGRKFEPPPGVRAVPDDAVHGGKGPLSGIAAALRATRCTRLLVLACDHPNIPADLLRLLADTLERAPCDVAFCEHGGQTEPLVAALRVEAILPAVEAALAGNRLKVDPLWRAQKCRVLADTDLAAFAPLERTFANANTLEELQGLERNS